MLREYLHLNDTTLEQIKSLALPEKGKYSDFVVAIGENAETTHVLPPGAYATRILAAYHLSPRALVPQILDEEALRFVRDRTLPVARCPIPPGLAALDELPEEHNGEVYEIEERVREAHLQGGRKPPMMQSQKPRLYARFAAGVLALCLLMPYPSHAQFGSIFSVINGLLGQIKRFQTNMQQLVQVQIGPCSSLIRRGDSSLS